MDTRSSEFLAHDGPQPVQFDADGQNNISCLRQSPTARQIQFAAKPTRLEGIPKLMASLPSKSVADIESFVNLLRVACDDPKINEQLERLLSFPDEKRQNMIHTWVSDMIIAQAPKDFIAAIACLRDDKIAEKAYEVIFKCKRGEAL